jgi:hypothetical protein
MVGMGTTEILILLTLFFSSGGPLSLPLSTPPLPPDPLLERAAPAECLAYLELAGLATPEADSDNPTERMLADPEMQEFLAALGSQAATLFREAAALPPEGKDASVTLIEAAGVADLEVVGGLTGMSESGVVSSLWIGCAETPHGLLAKPATGVNRSVLARLPSEAVLAQSWSLDLSAMLAAGLDVVAAGDPQAAAEIRVQLEQFRAIAGLDLDAHLLAPLGPDWSVVSVPAPGGLLPGFAIVAGVRERATFARTHKALLGILRNAAAAGSLPVSVRKIPYRDQTLFCLEAVTAEMPIPITPSWCLTDDRLIVTISPQLLKTLLARDPEDPGLGKLPEVKTAMEGGEPAFRGVVDPTTLLGTLCGLYEMAEPWARTAGRQQGLDVDLPLLPRASAIMQYAGPSVSLIRHDDDGILIESTGTIPLGPLTTGGGLLGVSPAATPVMVGLLLPAVQSAREAARRAQTQNQFRQVMLAMLTYESVRRTLPPQAICDDDGKPLLSWRVAILPYLEEGGLSNQFRLDEPWDSDHNLRLVEQMPAVYADPTAPAEQAARGLTTVQVMTGPDTPFPKPDEGRVRGRKSTRPGAYGVVGLTPPRVPRPARRSHPAVAEAPASLPRGVCPESQAEAGGHGTRHREHRQAVRCRDRPACDRRATHGRLLRHSGEAPVARHLPDCLGETHGPGGGGVSARVPEVWRRHLADRLHHRTGADPKDPHAPGRTTRTAADLARSWPARRLGRARADP